MPHRKHKVRDKSPSISIFVKQELTQPLQQNLDQEQKQHESQTAGDNAGCWDAVKKCFGKC